jgi:hypothetical protein
MRIVSLIVFVLFISFLSEASQVEGGDCAAECADRAAISASNGVYELEQHVRDLLTKREEAQTKLESCERVRVADADITRQLEESVAVEQRQVDAMKNVGDIVVTLESTIQAKWTEVEAIKSDTRTILVDAKSSIVKNREDIAGLKHSITLADVSAGVLEKEIDALQGSYFNLKKFKGLF